MERDKAQNRKRTREQESETKQSKKPEIGITFVEDCSEKPYEFYDSIGVFDFPWLKEGVGFKASDEFWEQEDVFSQYSRDLSHVPEYDTFGAGCVDEQSWVQSSPDSDWNLHVDVDEKGILDDGLWPLIQADDIEPLDCVWSSVIDQSPEKA